MVITHIDPIWLRVITHILAGKCLTPTQLLTFARHLGSGKWPSFFLLICSSLSTSQTRVYDQGLLTVGWFPFLRPPIETLVSQGGVPWKGPIMISTSRCFFSVLQAENGFWDKSLHETSRYLEDHPRTCKWLITMVDKSPKDRVVGPLANGRFMACKWGLLTTY